MPSDRQIAANRLNARRSTGPKTVHGKRRSRGNALRHGMTAETIVAVLETREAYEQFHRSIRRSYQPVTPIDDELISRLASLMWRLRRATAIEGGLLQIQAEIIQERKANNNAAAAAPHKLSVFYNLIPNLIEQQKQREAPPLALACHTGSNSDESQSNNPKRPELARSFLRLANLDNGVFDRLGRYEKSLWRQTLQVIERLSLIRIRDSIFLQR